MWRAGTILADREFHVESHGGIVTERTPRWLLALLPFVPVALVLHLLTPERHTLIFAASVFAILPGRAPLPFLNGQLLSQLLQQPGSTQMGPCV